jgi:bifunctional DNA-binding transcriptional regulator/antitoxin component of YhaV-PrlF toxin-antitoxin module
MEAEVKGVDKRGRIVLPKAWREKYLKGEKGLILAKDGTLEIKPFTAADLSEFFDKLDVDVKADLYDWHKVRK